MLHVVTYVLLAIVLPTSSHALQIQGLARSSKKTRVRVISDIHIGSCWGADKEVQTKLVALFNEMAKPNDNNPTHLVINGDLWDWWMVPLNQTHPDPVTLFENTNAHGYNVPDLIDLIKKASKQMKIYLVRGNHDDMNSKELTERAFGDAVEFMEDGFEINGVWIEHGSIADPYYNVPPKNGQKQMAWSYFESRAVSTTLGLTCKETRKRHSDFMANSFKKQEEFWAAMLDRYTPDTQFAQTLAPASFRGLWLEPLMEMALRDKSGQLSSNWTKFPVKGFDPITQKIKVNDESETYTLGDALADHADDADVGLKEMGREHFNARLWVSADNHFKWVPMSRNHLVVVTSHNHDPTSKLVQRLHPHQSVSQHVVQANSGAFGMDSFGRKHASYLDIEFDQLDEAIEGSLPKGAWHPTTVSYYEYPSPVPRETAAVPKPWPGKTVGGFDLALHPVKDEMIVGVPRSEFFSSES